MAISQRRKQRCRFTGVVEGVLDRKRRNIWLKCKHTLITRTLIDEELSPFDGHDTGTYELVPLGNNYLDMNDLVLARGRVVHIRNVEHCPLRGPKTKTVSLRPNTMATFRCLQTHGPCARLWMTILCLSYPLLLPLAMSRGFRQERTRTSGVAPPRPVLSKVKWSHRCHLRFAYPDRLMKTQNSDA